VGFGSYEFSDIDRVDEFTDIGLGVAYKMNKRARLEAGYRFHTQDSSGANADRDIDQNVFSIGIRIFP
jgi:hypothetical protein